MPGLAFVEEGDIVVHPVHGLCVVLGNDGEGCVRLRLLSSTYRVANFVPVSDLTPYTHDA